MSNNEYCICEKMYDQKLMYSFDDNEFCCMNCNLPKKGKINSDQEIVNWKFEYDLIYRIWLNSGSYENWAKNELENINSKINQIGIKLAEKYNCFYWLHRDNLYDKKIDIKCPSCGASMMQYSSNIINQKVCKKCMIVVGNK